MKRIRVLVPALLLVVWTAAATAQDLKTDTFQVTGEVSAADDSSVTVVKGKERFHIARDKNTKVTGDPKVGSKVTVKYQMYAKEVEVKADSGAKKETKKK